jgi:UPF0176 protein
MVADGGLVEQGSARRRNEHMIATTVGPGTTRPTGREPVGGTVACAGMRRVAIVLSLLAAACTAGPVESEPTELTSEPPPTTASPTTARPPAAPQPVADGPCPYLRTGFVAEANGQRVAKVRVSADTPHPACFFYRADGNVQLTVRVYTGDAGQAKALVDQAAPIATSNPAQLPGGWQGGSLATDTGAVYAVAKQATAVVVTTNQGQTIKARRVAEQTIAALKL